MQCNEVANKMAAIATEMTELGRDVHAVTGHDVYWHERAEQIQSAGAQLRWWSRQLRGDTSPQDFCVETPQHTAI